MMEYFNENCEWLESESVQYFVPNIQKKMKEVLSKALLIFTQKRCKSLNLKSMCFLCIIPAAEKLVYLQTTPLTALRTNVNVSKA